MPPLPIDDPGAVVLNVPYVSQNGYGNLCWAACCAMVFGYRGTNVALCQMATDRCGSGENCCPDPSSRACNQPQWPGPTLLKYGLGSYLYSDNALTLANVMYEINCKRPVMAVFQWLDAGGHAIVIAGYYPNGDLLVKDPLNGEGRLGYDYVNAAYGRGSWSESYYNLAPGNGTSS